MQERDSFNKRSGRWQIVFMLLITHLSGILWGAVPLSAQPATDPSPIPKQCDTLSTGNPGDTIADDLASLTLSQPEAKTEEILRRLGDSCDTRAVEALTARLGAESLSIRLAAIEGLGKLGGSDSATALVELLWSNPIPQIRLALIPAMIAFPSSTLRSIVRDLIAVNNSEKTDTPEKAHVKGVAMLALNQLTDNAHSRKAILSQYDLESSGIPAIQSTVAASMRGLPKTRNGVRELIGIFKKHSITSVRIWAATWLGKLRAEEAKEALQSAAANDKNAGVKTAAEAALRELGQPQVQ